MLRLRLPRFTYANVTASLALFVALGGTSYAAVKLKKDSVTTREVKDGSLQAMDLAPGVITSGPAGATGGRGPRGLEGPTGTQGDRGATGPQGPSNVRIAAPPLTALSRNIGATTTVAALRNLPAGSYFVTFTGEATLRVAGRAMYILCETRVNGVGVSATKGIVGDAMGGDAGLSDMIVVSRPGTFDVTIDCYSDQSTAGEPNGPVMDHTKLAAVKVDSVTTG